MGRPSTGTPILDDKLQLTLRFLIDGSYFVNGRGIGGWSTWSRNGRPIANMWLEVRSNEDHGYLTVAYTTLDGRKVKQIVNLTARNSNLGAGRGRVWYFVCPGTGKLCRKLYFANGKFYGRMALRNAIYQSQAETKSISRGCGPVPSWPVGKSKTYAGSYTKAYLRHWKAEQVRQQAFYRIAKSRGWLNKWKLERD